MKKGLLVVIALMALSGLMAAMAFTSATITNAASLTVAASDESLVALVPPTGVGTNDNYTTIDAGKLTIDMSKGLGGEKFGIQPNSTYKWEKLFVVQNNSNDAVQFNITKNGWGNETKVNAYIGAYKDGGDRVEFYNRNNTRTGMMKLQPGETATVYLYLETEGGAGRVPRSAELTVNVTAIETAHPTE